MITFRNNQDGFDNAFNLQCWPTLQSHSAQQMKTTTRALCYSQLNSVEYANSITLFESRVGNLINQYTVNKLDATI